MGTARTEVPASQGSTNSQSKVIGGPGDPLPELLEEVIVDQELTALEKQDQSEWGKKRRALSAFVDSVFFEYLTGIIILANITMIGIEAEMSLTMNEEMSWATNVEQAFLAVYTLELLLRIAGVEWSSIREVPLDFLSGLVATSQMLERQQRTTLTICCELLQYLV